MTDTTTDELDLLSRLLGDTGFPSARFPPWLNVSLCLNSTNDSCPSSLNASDPGFLEEERNVWAVVLCVFPLLTVFGNSLVVLSVCREKALQTATNFFIVSLAISDIMVALLVMPLSIYVEVSNSS